MTAPILRTKFYAPPVRPGLVSRSRLIERLNAGLWQAVSSGALAGGRVPIGQFTRRLTLVSAPAGFGKTTLIVDWLRQILLPQSSAQSVTPALAWLSLDADDNDPARFFTYLAGALETVRSEAASDAGALFASPQAPPLKFTLTVLLNALTQLDTPVLLVLDDYHTISDPAIHEAMTFFIEQLPPLVHLVIATRADPPLPLARLRSRRELCELGERDLRFSLSETATFFQEAMGLPLTTDNVRTLERRTEGWISGLQMAALALQSGLARPDSAHVARFIAAFDGSHRHVIDYLAQEVLNRQTPDMRRFLCQTAILDRLTAPLCDAVTGRSDSETILRTLEHRNLFVVPLDEQREWYRYHRLFGDFLSGYAEQHPAVPLADLHSRAARWYEAQGLFEQAVPHVLAAQDIPWAMRLLEKIALPVLMRGEAMWLLNWLDALPHDMLQSQPQMSLIYAQTLLVAGQFERVDGYLQAIDQQIELDPSQKDLGAQVKAMRAYKAIHLGELSYGFEMARQAQREMSIDNLFLRSIITWIVGFAQYFGEDVAEAQVTLRETLNQGQASGNVLVSALSIFITGYTHLLQGRLHQAQALYERGLRLTQAVADEGDLAWSFSRLPGVSLLYQGLAELHREKNDLDEAAAMIERCLELAEMWGNAEVLVDSYVIQAKICQSRHDRPGAQAAIERAMRLVRDNKVSALTALQICAHQARFHITWSEHDPALLSEADRWAADISERTLDPDLDGTHLALFLNWIEGTALARLRLAHGEYTQALARVVPLLQATQASDWHGIGIDLLSLQALALDGAGDGEGALDALQQALDLAAPQGYVRSVLDAGPGMRALLHTAQRCGMSPYVVHLLRALGDEPDVQPPVSQDLIEPLSEREREVLRLIADGLTNREIAGQLYLAVSTVKTHINNLYGKLGVSKRTQAVARGRQLGLL